MALVKTNGNSKTELVRVSPPPSTTPQVQPPVTKQVKAQRQWDRIGARLREITPSQAAHSALIIVALIGLGWLTWVCWTAFLPFEIGVVLAYVTLPLVNRLSKVMPRTMAALVVMLLEIAFVVAFFAVFIPIVVQEVGRAVQGLPSREELRAFITDLRTQVNTLPDPIPSLFGDWTQQTADNLRSNVGDYVGRLLGIIANTALGLVATMTFVLSLLVLPTWLLAILRDQPKATQVVQRAIPQTIRTDTLAIVRIIDRTLRVYLRGLLLSGVLVSLLVYGGFILLEALGFGPINYKIILALLAGLAMLVPTFGPIIGTIPPVLITLAYSQESALAVLLLYIGVYWLVGSLVTPLLQGEAVNLHPAILAMVLVAGSQFGLLGILVAAPLAVISRDLFRYVYGRTSDPPRPAGVLPGGELITGSHKQ